MDTKSAPQNYTRVVQCNTRGRERDRKVLNLFHLLVPVLCPQFVGAIYVFSARGVPLPDPRRVFFDAADPANLVMRVPQSVDDEDKVVSYYSWSRSEPPCSTYIYVPAWFYTCTIVARSSLHSHSANFVYQDNGSPKQEHVFQLFTPANLGTHGATVTDEGVLNFTVSHSR